MIEDVNYNDHNVHNSFPDSAPAAKGWSDTKTQLAGDVVDLRDQFKNITESNRNTRQIKSQQDAVDKMKPKK